MKKSRKKHDEERHYYNFDIDSEYEKYKNVGLEGADFLTYAQWKEHIVNIINEFTPTTRNNFKHYLIREKRKEDNLLRTVDSIWMPWNTVVLTIFLGFISAYAERVGKLFEDCGTLISDFVQKDGVFNAMKLESVVRSFQISVWFYGGVIIVVLLVSLGVYLNAKKRRKRLSSLCDFYKDIILIIVKEYEDKKEQIFLVD